MRLCQLRQESNFSLITCKSIIFPLNNFIKLFQPNFRSLQSASTPLVTRQGHFKVEFNFACTCFYCTNSITVDKLTYRSILELQAVLKESVRCADPGQKISNAEVIERLRDNWELITICKNNPRSREVFQLVHFQHNILYRLNFPLSFPCLTEKRLDGIVA